MSKCINPETPSMVPCPTLFGPKSRAAAVASCPADSNLANRDPDIAAPLYPPPLRHPGRGALFHRGKKHLPDLFVKLGKSKNSKFQRKKF